jgi:hypothetical protein
MNSNSGNNVPNEEEKVDKSLRRLKPIERKAQEPNSPAESLHTDSEDEG